uniref:NRPS n=1 Tax=uncultured bacterium 14-4D TaxID=1497525 RepID=A0A059U2G1_9BACT|nr:NRPS [uncultured bacterium 14-4D]
MSELADRIANLSPEKKRLLAERLLSRRTSSDAAVHVLPRRSQEGPAPLSFAQQRLWFLAQFERNSSAYHIPLVLRLKRDLDVAALEAALTEISTRHEALRTVFSEIEGEPRQRLLPSEPVSLPCIDLSATPDGERRAAAERVAKEQAREPFELSEGPVVRFALLRLAEDEHWLLATFHHIVADGWSLGVFQDELLASYAARAQGEASALPELAVQYADYAVWQRNVLGEEALANKLDYWRQRLEGAPSLLELPTDRPRPATQSHRGTHYRAVMPSALGKRVQSLATSHDATLFMVLLAAVNVLLSRYSGQKDICVGSPIAGRTRTELEKLIGVFINTLVLRTDLSGEPSFLELLQRVREATLGAFSHQEVPFEKLVEELQPERALSHSPLFQVMLVLQNAPAPTTKLDDIEVERTFFDIGTAMFDLTFFVVAHEKGLGFSVEYSTDLFDEATIARMMSQLETLLESIVEAPERRISELQMLPQAERDQLLVEWNATASDYPREACVHELIAAQAERTPDKVAVSFGEASLSYAELEERSNRLARYLTTMGVGEESRVGVYLERSLEMVVALVGVLKAGGAYVPLDPSFPRQRLQFMMRDADVAVVLSQTELTASMPEHDATVLEMDGEWPTIARESAAAVTSPARADTLAYVIYTSGSTGAPKGVQIEHRALVNFLCSMQREPGLVLEDRLLAVTTLSFDIAGLELYLPLITGGTVIVASREETSDGRRLAELIHSSRATVMQATPATWRMLLDSGWKGERRLKVLCGGERLARELADELVERCETLWNVYGPTETTIWSTVQHMEAGAGPVLVGRPIANTTVYLLDAHAHPVPTGVAGELWIGGEGLARGYLDRDELTAERFVPDPFADSDGARMYRTGDLARYRPNGELEVLGRLDHQVKARGFRIELGEIESVLATHPEIRQVVVVAREDAPGDPRLVAYFAAESNSPSVSELRAHLQQKLPDYMVPSAFVALDALPLTPNGKVDTNALPAPDETRPELDHHYVAPRNSLELQLAAIWQDVLGVERVGVHDNFFELGGHSLMAVRLFAKIEDLLGSHLPLATLFRASTIAQLTRAMHEADDSPSWSCLVPIQPGDGRPPLFCIHAEGGEVLFYRDFARLLGPEQPVYGIQATGLDGTEPPLETIEEMATHYISELRRIQPEGPYFLGGHCYGGVIMYEMVQQLHRTGERVALAAMMDSSAPLINQTLTDKLRYGLEALARSPLDLLRHVVVEEIGARLRWRRRPDPSARDTTPASETHARVGKGIENAYLTYQPQPYPGSIIYFMNSERARLGHVKWRELVDELEMHIFPGTPNTTFISPSVEVLAAKVRACLQATAPVRDEAVPS